MHEPASVVATGLVKRFGPVTALDGVDLEIQRGEVFGLIGPNGAGKTTLIRAVVGALRPTEGSVTVLGLDPLDARWELRKRVGYMPQQAALYPDLSAKQNLTFFASAHRQKPDGADVERILELVELTARADDPVRTLSGGMRQRVSLGCVLVHEPELLILDEPTAGVDPELRAAFWDHFHRIAADGATVIVSTHQMDEALQCERVALLRAGAVVADDDPAVLLRSNKATVHLWDGRTESTISLDDYPTQLPGLVRPGLDRVEIELEPLDEIVLALVNEEEVQ